MNAIFESGIGDFNIVYVPFDRRDHLDLSMDDVSTGGLHLRYDENS